MGAWTITLAAWMYYTRVVECETLYYNICLMDFNDDELQHFNLEKAIARKASISVDN